jgi:hypothetical protein
LEVEIRLRIPLDVPSDGDPVPRPKLAKPRPSTDMRLRSVGVDELTAIVGVQAAEWKRQSTSDLGQLLEDRLFAHLAYPPAERPAGGHIHCAQGEEELPWTPDCDPADYRGRAPELERRFESVPM